MHALSVSHARSLKQTKLMPARPGKPEDQTIWKPSEKIPCYAGVSKN